MKQGKHSNIAEVTPSSYSTLYVSMHNFTEKKKEALLVIRNALILQEEYERVIEIRRQKKELLDSIKKEFNSLNSSYQEVKKMFPNVKSILTNTEKEIVELNTNIEALKRQSASAVRDIGQQEEMLEELKNSMPKVEKETKKKKTATKPAAAPAKKTTKKESAPVKKVAPKKEEVKVVPKDKLDRIKHNLKIIERKLGNV